MITIIGAGIGGLATALAFEQLKIDYQIFEQAPALNEVGAGIWLAPNALQVMEWLGILEEIQAAGNSIDRITLANHKMIPISDSDQKMIKKTFGYSTIAIHRAKLQKILFDKIPMHKITLGRQFERYELLSSDTINIFFEDGAQYETNHLIGADGIHSNVRKQLFPASEIRYSGQTCWRGIADFQLNEDFQHRGFEMWGNRKRFGISAIAKDKVYWFAVASSRAGEKDDSEQIKNKLQDNYSSFPSLVVQLIQNTSTERILRNDIYDLKPMKQWHKENICLIGDAAHATTPNMGQGGAQAIEDAFYLSNSIHQSDSIRDAFKLFQGKRFQKVNAIVKQSWSTGQMAHWKYGRRLRNFMLKSLPKRFVQKKMMEIYQINKSFARKENIV